MASLRFAVVLLALGATTAQAASPHTPPRSAFTPADLVSLRRLSDPQVSPDGRYVAFVLRSATTLQTVPESNCRGLCRGRLERSCSPAKPSAL